MIRNTLTLPKKFWLNKWRLFSSCLEV